VVMVISVPVPVPLPGVIFAVLLAVRNSTLANPGKTLLAITLASSLVFVLIYAVICFVARSSFLSRTVSMLPDILGLDGSTLPEATGCAVGLLAYAQLVWLLLLAQMAGHFLVWRITRSALPFV